MIEVGIASAAMIVERTFQRKRKTTIAANIAPRTRCSSIACSEFSINSDWSRMIAILKSFGSVGMICAIRCLDVADQGDGVRTGLFADCDGDRRTAVERKRVASGPHRRLDTADVLELDRKTVFGRDDDVVELLDLRQLADRAQADRLCALDQRSARQLLILCGDGGRDLIDGKPVCTQPVRVDVELDLLWPAAENDDLTDAVSRLDLFLDQRRDQIGQFDDIPRSELTAYISTGCESGSLFRATGGSASSGRRLTTVLSFCWTS